MVDIAGRIPLDRLASGDAAVDQVLTWNGRAWVAGPVPLTAVVIPVLHGDPTSPVEGQLWFDLDATC